MTLQNYSGNWHRARCTVRPVDKAQRGAVAIMSLGVLLMIIGCFALAIDLSRIYNRRAELHSLANSVALVAARQLNGTRPGIEAALAAARSLIESRINGPAYGYGLRMTWNDAAITFGAARNGAGGWRSSTDALNAPNALRYAKVDTSALNANYGTVDLIFARILAPSLTSVTIAHSAVAGKERLHVTPLGICAMSSTPQSRRANTSDASYDELVEYGFRRGVSYDLMNLNPGGTTALSFQVDPVQLANGSNPDTHFSSALYSSYICSGTMAVSAVTGATVRVKQTFPIDLYHTHLNARFDSYTGTCDVHAAGPDTNVKAFTFGSINWMPTKATVQSAFKDSASTTRLQTVADKGPPNHPVTTDYGALWTFARAVPWSSYETQGAPEPAEGYVPFNATSAVWQALYGATATIGNYPQLAPYYQTSNSSYYVAPTSSRKPGTRERRILNIPLLACPVTGAEATVLAIGKFLLTVPATSTAIHAEFGGISTDAQVSGLVEIYQ